VRRPAVGALIKSLQDKEVSTFFWTKQSSQQSMGDPNSVAYQLLKDTKMLRAAGELSVCAFSRDHMFVVNGKPQIVSHTAQLDACFCSLNAQFCSAASVTPPAIHTQHLVG
jgi:hypothetical protein